MRTRILWCGIGLYRRYNQVVVVVRAFLIIRGNIVDGLCDCACVCEWVCCGAMCYMSPSYYHAVIAPSLLGKIFDGMSRRDAGAMEIIVNGILRVSICPMWLYCTRTTQRSVYVNSCVNLNVALKRILIHHFVFTRSICFYPNVVLCSWLFVFFFFGLNFHVLVQFHLQFCV